MIFGENGEGIVFDGYDDDVSSNESITNENNESVSDENNNIIEFDEDNSNEAYSEANTPLSGENNE